MVAKHGMKITYNRYVIVAIQRKRVMKSMKEDDQRGAIEIPKHKSELIGISLPCTIIQIWRFGITILK